MARQNTAPRRARSCRFGQAVGRLGWHEGVLRIRRRRCRRGRPAPGQLRHLFAEVGHDALPGVLVTRGTSSPGRVMPPPTQVRHLLLGRSRSDRAAPGMPITVPVSLWRAGPSRVRSVSGPRECRGRLAGCGEGVPDPCAQWGRHWWRNGTISIPRGDGGPCHRDRLTPIHDDPRLVHPMVTEWSIRPTLGRFDCRAVRPLRRVGRGDRNSGGCRCCTGSSGTSSSAPGCVCSSGPRWRV